MRQVISIQSRVDSSGVPACWKSKDPIAWNIAGRLSDITCLYICPCMRYLCMHDIILNMQEGVESTRYAVSRDDIYLSWF